MKFYILIITLCALSGCATSIKPTLSSHDIFKRITSSSVDIRQDKPALQVRPEASSNAYYGAQVSSPGVSPGAMAVGNIVGALITSNMNTSQKRNAANKRVASLLPLLDKCEIEGLFPQTNTSLSVSERPRNNASITVRWWFNEHLDGLNLDLEIKTKELTGLKGHYLIRYYGEKVTNDEAVDASFWEEDKLVQQCRNTIDDMNETLASLQNEDQDAKDVIVRMTTGQKVRGKIIHKASKGNRVLISGTNRNEWYSVSPEKIFEL